jgi:hypothetical protein
MAFATDSKPIQEIIKISCYIDIPISIVIEKLKKIEESSNDVNDDFIKYILSNCVVIIDWIKNSKIEHVTILEYINFLEEHREKVRDFIRIPMFKNSVVNGTYVKDKESNHEFICIDEDYIDKYEYLVKYFELGIFEDFRGIDLRDIPSTKIKPHIIYPKIQDAGYSVKTAFACNPRYSK